MMTSQADLISAILELSLAKISQKYSLLHDVA